MAHGPLAPDHKTIADFRKDNGRAIRQVCARFVELCRLMGLATFDVRELSDEELERMIFGTPLNLPPMSKLERRRILAPVLEAMAETSIKMPETDPEQ